MKKFVLLLCVFMIFTFTACEEPHTDIVEKPHNHIWEEKEVKESTCVENGYTLYVCSCGAENKVEIEAAHSYGEDGVCTVCSNNKAEVEAAEARIGLKYYANFEDAVNDSLNYEKAVRVVEVLKDNIDFGAHVPEINGSITINANGANFNYDDVSIYTYQNNNKKDPEQGEIDIVINDANNLYVWGEPGSFLAEDSTLNIILTNFNNVGEEPNSTGVNTKGRMVYLTGTKGTTNITLENSYCKNVDSPVYTNNPGNIVVRNTEFKNTSVPLNFNFKAAEGQKNILVENCTFDSCGVNELPSPSIYDYSAPVRVVNTSSASGECTVTVKGTTFKNTLGENGDVLIVVKGGKYKSVTANIENNKTDVAVNNYFEDQNIVVKAGQTKTIESKLVSATN